MVGTGACLGECHMIRTCPSNAVCFYCKRDTHHGSICYSKFPSIDSNGKSVRQSINTIVTCKNNSQNDIKNEIVTELKNSIIDLKKYIDARFDTEIKMPENTGLLFESKTEVILTTAHINARKNSDTHLTEKCRILMDSGSQRTIVKKELSDKLGLIPIAFDIVTIAGFAQEIPLTVILPRVRIELQLQDGTYRTFEANVNDKITHSIKKVAIDTAKYPALQGFMSNSKLAEPLIDKSQNVEIDMLIGNDYCFE